MSGPVAKCSDLDGFEDSIDETISDIIKLKGAIGVITGAIAIIGGLGTFSIVALSMIAAAAGPGLIILTSLTKAIKLLCRPGPSGRPDQCASGVVVSMTPSFSSGVQTWFPMTALHDRVDLVVKSDYWWIVEYSDAKVICTETNDLQRRSEVLRCYFYDPQVCEAARRAWEGAAIGAVLGLVIGAVVGALLCGIGLCVLGVIVAALISAALTTAGGAAGSAIGQASSDDLDPSGESGLAISTGDLVSFRGNLVRSGVDGGANVFWWVSEAFIIGEASSSVPSNPYSHCEIDLQLEGIDLCDPGPIIE